MVELEASVQRQTLKMMDNMLKKMGVDAAIEVGQVGAGLALPVAVLAIGLFTWALTWSSHSVLVTLLQHTQSGDSLYMGLGVSMAFTLAFVMGHAMAALWFFRHALAAVDSAIASHRERAAKARAIMQASGVGGTDGLVDETGAHLPTRKLQDGDEIFIISRLDTKLMVFTDGTIRATGEVAYNAEHNDVVFIVYMDHNGRVALQAKGTEKFISMSSASLRCAKDIPGPSDYCTVDYPGPGKITFKAVATGRYVSCADDATVRANARKPGDYEIFTYEFVDSHVSAPASLAAKKSTALVPGGGNVASALVEELTSDLAPLPPSPVKANDVVALRGWTGEWVQITDEGTLLCTHAGEPSGRCKFKVLASAQDGRYHLAALVTGKIVGLEFGTPMQRVAVRSAFPKLIVRVRHPPYRTAETFELVQTMPGKLSLSAVGFRHKLVRVEENGSINVRGTAGAPGQQETFEVRIVASEDLNVHVE